MVHAPSDEGPRALLLEAQMHLGPRSLLKEHLLVSSGVRDLSPQLLAEVWAR